MQQHTADPQLKCDLLCDVEGEKDERAEMKRRLRRSCSWKHGNPAEALDGAVGEDSGAAVTFFPDGSARGRGLSISNGKGDRVVVEVFKATALPYVYKHAEE